MFFVFLFFCCRGEREREREDDDNERATMKKKNEKGKNSLSPKTHHSDHGPARVDSDAAGLDAADEPRGLDLERCWRRERKKR